MSPRVLIKSQTRSGIAVVPVSVEIQWQAYTPSGIDASPFVLDGEQRLATCPQGKTRTSGSRVSRTSHPELITIPFSPRIAARARVFPMVFHPPAPIPAERLSSDHRREPLALQAARKLQQTETFPQTLLCEKGIRRPFPQRVRALDLPRSRSLGLPKPHMQHLAIATPIHLPRLVNWRDGIPLAPPRVSALRGFPGRHEECASSLF